MDDHDRQFFQENNVTFNGGEYYTKPVYDYLQEPRLTPDIKEKMRKLNFLKPTPIQAIGVPMILDGKDFIGKFILYIEFFYFLCY